MMGTHDNFLSFFILIYIERNVEGCKKEYDVDIHAHVWTIRTIYQVGTMLYQYSISTFVNSKVVGNLQRKITEC